MEICGIVLTTGSGRQFEATGQRSGLRAPLAADQSLMVAAAMPSVLVEQAKPQGAAVATLTHLGRRGNPLTFYKVYLTSLLALQDDTGARHWRSQAHDRVARGPPWHFSCFPYGCRFRSSGALFPFSTPRRNDTNMITLNVNGLQHKIDIDPATPVLWALRDTLGLTGTKFGCGAALCGACTVHLDGKAIRSCVTSLASAAGKKITTIEAATDGRDRVGQAVHAAWVKHDVAQCGYCQSGQIMSATAFLKALPRGKQPSVAQIDSAMAGNICRCGTYVRIRAAIADAARALT
jgi:isoquinoline 1-oxidoreductase alpha subunit